MSARRALASRLLPQQVLPDGLRQPPCRPLLRRPFEAGRLCARAQQQEGGQRADVQQLAQLL